MATKIILEGKEYEVNSLSERLKEVMVTFEHVEKQLADKNNLLAVLTRAKKSYIEELKRDVLAEKAGFDFLD